MTAKENKVSKLGAAQPSPTHGPQNSSTSNWKGKDKDAIIPTKDKSPDDLEILN